MANIKVGEFVVAKGEIGFSIAKVKEILEGKVLVIVADNKNKGDECEIASNQVAPLSDWVKEVNTALRATDGNCELDDLVISHGGNVEALKIVRVSKPLLLLKPIDPSAENFEEVQMMVNFSAK